MPRLGWNGYGKAAIHLVRVDREQAGHQLHDLTVEVQLQGDFEAAHTVGDNSRVLPTDTMRNTVYAMARQHPVEPLEPFGESLARHFLQACPAARRAVISLARHAWARIPVAGTPHRHAFSRGLSERRSATVTVDESGTTTSAGLEGLGLLKTTGSAFSGFLTDRHTTLQETRDRILATDLAAEWRYARPPADWTGSWDAVRRSLVETFATHQSESVQHTLYAMGEAALETCSEAAEIRLLLPNRHHLLVDLSRLDLENPNQIFVATSEPYGRIEAVIAR